MAKGEVEMVSKRVALLLGMLMLGGGIEHADAQPGSSFAAPERYRRPSAQAYNNVTRNQNVSPYLNLTRRQGRFNSSPNYQSFVVPELERRKSERQQAAAVQRLQQQVAANQTPEQATGGSRSVRSTGHTSQYFYYSHFFPRLAR